MVVLRHDTESCDVGQKIGISGIPYSKVNLQKSSPTEFSIEKNDSTMSVFNSKFQNKKNQSNHIIHVKDIENNNDNYKGGDFLAGDDSTLIFHIQFIDDLDPFQHGSNISSGTIFTSSATIGYKFEPTIPVSFAIHTQIPLINQIPSVIKLLNAPHKPEDCALQIYKRSTGNSDGSVKSYHTPTLQNSGEFGTYLDLDSTLAEQQNEINLIILSNEDLPTLLILRTKITIRIHKIIEKLLNSNGRQLRRSLFALKQLFQDDKDLVHQFIHHDGLACLIKVGMESDQNYQNYILRALSQIMLYVDGMEGVKRHNESLQWLYSLLTSKYRLVIKTALKLLLVFLEYREEHAYYLLKSVFTIEPNGPLKLVIELLDDRELLNDTDILIHSITLINRILAQLNPTRVEIFLQISNPSLKCKIPVSLNELVKLLENQGLNRIIQRYLEKIDDPKSSTYYGDSDNGLDTELIDQFRRYITLTKLSSLTNLVDAQTINKHLYNSNIDLTFLSNNHSRPITNPNNATFTNNLSNSSYNAKSNFICQRDNNQLKKINSESNIVDKLDDSLFDTYDKKVVEEITDEEQQGDDAMNYMNQSTSSNSSYNSCGSSSFMLRQNENSMKFDIEKTSSIASTAPFYRNYAINKSMNDRIFNPPTVNERFFNNSYLINNSLGDDNNNNKFNAKQYSRKPHDLGLVFSSFNCSKTNSPSYFSGKNQFQDSMANLSSINDSSHQVQPIFSWRDKFKKSDLVTVKKLSEYQAAPANITTSITNQSKNLLNFSGDDRHFETTTYYPRNKNLIMTTSQASNENYLKMIPSAKPSNGPTPSSARSKFQYLESLSKNNTSVLNESFKNVSTNHHISNIPNSTKCLLTSSSSTPIDVPRIKMASRFALGTTIQSQLPPVKTHTPQYVASSLFQNNAASPRNSHLTMTNNKYLLRSASKNQMFDNLYKPTRQTSAIIEHKVISVKAPAIRDMPTNLYTTQNYDAFKASNRDTGVLSMTSNPIPFGNNDSKISNKDLQTSPIKEMDINNICKFTDPTTTNPLIKVTTGIPLNRYKEEVQKYESESQQEWNRLLKNLRRPLIIADLNFTDLHGESDSDDVEDTTSLNWTNAKIYQRPISPTLLLTSKAPVPPPLPIVTNDIRGTSPPTAPPPPPILLLPGSSNSIGGNAKNGMPTNSLLTKNLSSSTLCLTGISKTAIGLTQNLMIQNRKTLRLFWRELRLPSSTNCFNSYSSTKTTHAKFNEKKIQTIWDTLRPIRIDENRLEYLFETRAKELLPKDIKNEKQKGQIIVLDSKRSNAINIGMTKLPPTRAIKTAIMKMDNSIMSRENIEKLLTTMIPTEEEKQKILDAQMAHPQLPLGTAEQFLLTISTIPEIRARLKLWSFKLDYDGMERDIGEPLMDLKIGLEEIKENKTVKYVLTVILCVGNFLNGSQCKGFHIDYLCKLPEIKDTVQKQTLLHHVCEIVMEKFNDSTDIYSEIGNLVRSSRVDFEDLFNNLDKMEYLCKESWDNLRSIIKYENGPVLKIRMSEFINDCAQRVMILKIVHRRLLNRYKRTLRYFGIEPLGCIDGSGLKITQFCRIFTDFALEYKTCRERFLENVKKKQKSKERSVTRGKMIIDTIKRNISFGNSSNNSNHVELTNPVDSINKDETLYSQFSPKSTLSSKFSFKNLISGGGEKFTLNATQNTKTNDRYNEVNFNPKSPIMSADKALQTILLSPSNSINLVSAAQMNNLNTKSRKSEPFYASRNKPSSNNSSIQLKNIPMGNSYPNLHQFDTKMIFTDDEIIAAQMSKLHQGLHQQQEQNPLSSASDIRNGSYSKGTSPGISRMSRNHPVRRSIGIPFK